MLIVKCKLPWNLINMPTKKAQVPVKAWSFSRLQDYRQCPFKFKLRVVDKLQEPPNEAMQRGIDIHNEAEEYINGTIKKLPESLKLFEDNFKELLEFEAVAEEQWALDNEWVETGWFDPNTWVRIKVDCNFIVDDGVIRVIDFKTGKIRDGYGEQLDLYALAAMALFEGVKKVETQLWYLDQGIIVGAHSNADDKSSMERSGIYTPGRHLVKLQRHFVKETKAMLNDTRFAPKPNAFCKWCHFRKDNGGPCRY